VSALPCPSTTITLSILVPPSQPQTIPSIRGFMKGH
jgi:hypothetical protein